MSYQPVQLCFCATGSSRHKFGAKTSSGHEIIRHPHLTLAAAKPELFASPEVVLRLPDPCDGPAVTGLIRRCPPLDVNSAYCNLVQCAHFADTCVVAEKAGRVVGWVSAHRPPSAPDQIFVWQVAVGASARGAGLGGQMLEALLARPAVRDAKMLTTTVTASNTASWGLFEGFARRRTLQLSRTPLFTREIHFAGAHDTEWEVSIGPLRLDQDQSVKETR